MRKLLNNWKSYRESLVLGFLRSCNLQKRILITSLKDYLKDQNINYGLEIIVLLQIFQIKRSGFLYCM